MNTSLPTPADFRPPPLLLAVFLAALAGGMGWGIRGQYGHETGAMIAGVLVSLVLVLLFLPGATALTAARAVALGTIGISFGGSMTYGQTVGLTHDAPLIGNHAALFWGLLGLGVKGAIWIGFFGVLLGMGLSGRRYRPADLAIAFWAVLFLYFLGLYLLNHPYDPANKELPRIYFSDDWRWESGDLNPRREKWGALLFALIGLIAFARWWRQDHLAFRLAGWGALGGGLGFPLGQCLQAGYQWNRDWFAEGLPANIAGVTNWWNMMETGFGAIFGAIIAVGLWRNRHLIRLPDLTTPAFSIRTEITFLLIHVTALVVWNFASFGAFDVFADTALFMGAIPLIACLGGRHWPFLMVLPITLIPIAGKTVRELGYRVENWIPSHLAWIVYLCLPLIAATTLALYFSRSSAAANPRSAFVRAALLFTTWVYFALNWEFFRRPWPWDPFEEWTARTPNGILFTISVVGLTLAACFYRHRRLTPVDEALEASTTTDSKASAFPDSSS
ncbi:MAG: hypothetical protein AAF514_01210 [Verrucomicrobiota bacterium]